MKAPGIYSLYNLFHGAIRTAQHATMPKNQQSSKNQKWQSYGDLMTGCQSQFFRRPPGEADGIIGKDDWG